ncbi:glutamyl-tRNA reductase [Methylomarinovum caldicuralii]|uniref:Glutamyl-tRNA reductase n=1 Tax=Methylomarinovum caldicuralii TaxID=438856 RepID=A0AAU9C590_9GAMM|nr:glutamyl-tRNA reductase [Methylomarinovum caldicuralii]BCX80556.1 glutamyl-tRNA reductase [Methylomarinovum caldicuralii]
MTLLALGLNHTTAPVAVRERLAFPGDRATEVLRTLLRLPGVQEAALLSTCNRTEVYCRTEHPDPKLLVNWLAETQQIEPEDFEPYLYVHTDAATIRHLFRVACGLDSMVLGEPQILGQIKDAYQAARQAGALGKILSRLFQHTFSAAKKVRTDTAIGASPISVAFAAVRLAQQIFDGLGEQTALLIGAGETIELTARHLHQQGIGRIIVANRTFDKAHALAAQFGGYAIALRELPAHLHEGDIVVSSTASQLPILGKGAIERAVKKRRHKPIFMVDLAVPRDIEPEVETLDDVYLYTVDDLQDIVEENRQARREAALEAEEIIDMEVEHFLAWLRAQGAGDTIRALRRQAEDHKQAALERARRALQRGASPEEALELLAHTLTQKLLHTPSVQLKQAGSHERHDLIAAARELFKLT